MDSIIIGLLLVIAAEATYLTIRQGQRFKSLGRQARPIFVDTSVLIDGRIVAIAQTGFLTSTLYIPRSVVGELQFLADNADADKRSRARHGLDVIKELQTSNLVRVEIFADSARAEEGVDNRLLTLAKRYKAALCTIDFNLNKVAQVENIPVLNVNDLAMNLRMAYLPGEKTTIELTQKGNDSHQAVGHLSDGTMVVVEHANNLIGQSAEVEFIRSLQTAAGRMMFARLTSAKERPAKKPAQPRRQERQARVEHSSQPARPEQPRRDNRQASAPRKPVRQQPRRRTNEDKLIDLANRQ